MRKPNEKHSGSYIQDPHVGVLDIRTAGFSTCVSQIGKRFCPTLVCNLRWYRGPGRNALGNRAKLFLQLRKSSPLCASAKTHMRLGVFPSCFRDPGKRPRAQQCNFEARTHRPRSHKTPAAGLQRVLGYKETRFLHGVTQKHKKSAQRLA